MIVIFWSAPGSPFGYVRDRHLYPTPEEAEARRSELERLHPGVDFFGFVQAGGQPDMSQLPIATEQTAAGEWLPNAARQMTSHGRCGAEFVTSLVPIPPTFCSLPYGHTGWHQDGPFGMWAPDPPPAPPDGWEVAVEWAVRVDHGNGTTTTSSPFYRREHAEREAQHRPGARVVFRQVHAGPWVDLPAEQGSSQ